MTVVQLHPDDRCCVVCGDSIEDRRPDALTCGAKCRRERSRLLALLAGENVSGGRSVAEYLNSGERACKAPPKINRGRALIPESRTTRAGRFVDERCQARPGQLTIARVVYDAYVEWCEFHEANRPLSRSAFDAVVARRAPLEDRVSVAGGGRGRPRLAYRGLALVESSPSSLRREAA